MLQLAFFDNFPVLEAGEFTLRRLRLSDAKPLFDVLSDHEVCRYYDDDAFTNLEQAVEQIETWQRGYDNRWLIRWGIVRKNGGPLLGTCGYHSFHTLHMKALIGYELSRRAWRQGIMSKALQVMIDFGFDTIRLNRIDAGVMPDNAASIGLLEKLGFKEEGIMREFESWANKGLVNLSMLSLLRSERQ